ncbi:hypothetical protein BJ170DRAFT_220365 [Xylariales sp. AK1849]|nr:hypothetical protein BJ170DRAFT_220365 [Xylariales sp. AK1849]
MTSRPKDEEDAIVSVKPSGLDEDVEEAPERFSPEEETASEYPSHIHLSGLYWLTRMPPRQNLLGESNDKKSEANKLFSSASYAKAITKYEEAASICPHYLDYELAVLQSNIAACHLKLEQWKEAITSATKAVDGLDRLEKAEASGEVAKDQHTGSTEDEDEAEEEIVSSGAQKSAPAAKEETTAEQAKRKRKDDILRIRAKALMRRARAKSELGGWANLSGAEEDYKLLSTMSNLSAADKKIVLSQLRTMPPRTKAAQEKEMGEMLGKVKDLGNGFLKYFGLSTDNFNMVKDEKTGGYSMNFNQDPQ